ncbi:MAG: hypothetical protein E6I30_11820 [Chloroflexi bacterium]|nr:MAG: hypothetical protein E6I30_11820 [Chloroflexota bacterium]
MKVGPFLIALVLLAGCVPDGSPLPTATAELYGASIELPRGSYCWNSGGHAACADSPGAETLLRMGDLKPYATAGGYDIQTGVYVYAVSGTWPEGDVTFFLTLKVSPETA